MQSERPASAPVPDSCGCRPLHRGAPVDVAALNRPAIARLARGLDPAREVDCLIVPGYTPRVGVVRGMNPKMAARCDAAAADLRAAVAPVAIVSGGTVRGPDNEAMLMREALLARGARPEQLLVEPCARHTTTNLRNAGRMMHRLGLATALVVTSEGHPLSPLRIFEQAYYLGHPLRSSFHLRCLARLGYTVGELAWARPGRVRFAPAIECLRESAHATREGDP